MNYTSLYKLYFTEPDEGKAIYRGYNQENAIHIPIRIHDYQAFVCCNQEINDLIRIIETTKRPIVSTDQYKDEVRASNAIEGIMSTHEKDKSLQRYYQRLQEGEMIRIMSVQDLRALYDDILCDVIDDLPDGNLFRQESVSIYEGSHCIHHGSYLETHIIEDLDYALSFLNNQTYPLLLRVCIFHYLFAYIHPFYDGNGRFIRFITSSYLTQLSTSLGLTLSSRIYQHKKAYYKAFKITSDPRNRGDLTYFVHCLLEMIY